MANDTLGDVPEPFHKTDAYLDILRTGRTTPWKQDPRLFKLTKDHGPEGVLVHFLPGIGDASPIITYRRHTVPHVNRNLHTRYMQPCGVDLGQRCPVCDVDPALGRITQQWAANIVIGEDNRGDQTQNGKVFILEFGAQIADKLEMAGVDGLDPFDLSEMGAWFTLKASFKGVAPNYRDSEFFVWGDGGAVPTPERYLKRRHDLTQFPSLPPYEVLTEQFRKFTGVL